MLYQLRLQKFEHMYQKALQRAHDTQKKLLLIGDKPKYNLQRSDVSVEIHVLDLDHISHELSIASLNDYIIMESFVFESITNEAYQTVKTYLRTKSPEDMFFMQTQPFSLSAWLYGNDSKVPRRIFIFHPPFDKFVFSISNPLYKCEKFISNAYIQMLIVTSMLCLVWYG